MARVIKTYPKRDGWPDSLDVSSDTLKHIGPPHVSLKIYSVSSNRFNEAKTLNIKLETKSGKPGVKIYGEGKLLKEIDETEFFDKACDDIDSMTRSFYALPYVSGIVKDAKNQLAVKLFEDDGTLSAPIKFDGIGFILSDKNPIAGIGTLDISAEGIVQFKNCVNAYDLSEVKDARIIFSTHNRSLEFIPEGKVECQSDAGLCSYSMEYAIITPLGDDSSEVSLLKQAGFVYEKNNEEFADKVVAFINSLNPEEQLDIDFDDFDFD